MGRLRLGLSSEILRYTLAMYGASRVLYMVVAIADSLVRHTSIATELHNWDGKWYVLTEQHGYPLPFNVHFYTTPGHWSTYGFLPLFPLLEWLVVHTIQLSVVPAGFTLSLIFGLLATLLVTRLASAWWGEEAARRAVPFWCFFPGTIVFSMVYTEGLTIALVAGCFLLLERRRWILGGLLAGLSTAVAPVAFAVMPACGVAALLELRRHGWRDREALKSLWAPALSTLGAAAFAIFLWIWAGTPLASFDAQHGAWQESSTPLAIPDVFGSLIHQIFISGVGNHGPGGIDLNGISALLGTAFLFYGLRLMWKVRETIPATVWTWTLVAALLALTSAKTPPNPRLLITMFPVVMIIGAHFTGRARTRLLIANVVVLLLMSPITYEGGWLRP